MSMVLEPSLVFISAASNHRLVESIMKLNVVRMSGIFLVFLLSVLSCGDAHRIAPPEEVATASQALSSSPDFVLTPFPGAAFDIGVGPASPWVLGMDSQPYQYTGGPGQRVWQRHPLPSGYAIGIAVSPEGTPWVIQVNGEAVNIVSFSNSTWTTLAFSGGPACFSDIGVGSTSIGIPQIWAIGCDDDLVYGSSIYVFNPFAATWVQESGRARRVAVGPEGGVWVINALGSIFAWSTSTNSFDTQLLGCAKAIGAGPNATPWVIGCDDHPYRWTGTQFVQASTTTGTEISVGADGTPWLTNSQNQISQYVSSWQFVGPQGFLVNNLPYTGEIHDIDATGPNLVVGATAGGVWQEGAFGGWTPIADVGSAQGPNASAGTVAVKPGDQSTIIVGTGVTGTLNNGTNAFGNGIWFTHDGGATWSGAICDGSAANCPRQVTKIRYANAGTVYVAGLQSILKGSEQNQVLTFQTQWSSPTSNVTDLVVDPNDKGASTVYFAVIPAPGQAQGAQGVYRSTTGGSNPVLSSPTPPPISSNPITYIALAITASTGGVAGVTGVYAMSAASGLPNKDYPNFNGIAYTDNSRWPTWNPMTPQPTSSFSNGNLDSQLGHNWALAIDSTGATILAAGRNLFRGSNCAYAHCDTWAQVDHNNVTPSLHDDYHALAFSTTSPGVAFAANDGGIYSSSDSGLHWSDAINTLGVANETGLDVDGSAIYATAWDVGANFTNDSGASWHGNGSVSGGVDMQNALLAGGNAYLCRARTSTKRWTARISDVNASWTERDNAPVASDGLTCFMAQSANSPLFTSYKNAVYTSTTGGASWVQYQQTPWPAGLLAVTAQDIPPTVYVSQLGGTGFQVSRLGGLFQSITVLPPNHNVAFLALNRDSDNLYVLGSIGNPGRGGVVYETSDRGQTWTQLTGNLNPGELVSSAAWDPSTRAAFVGTQGTAAAGMYKLVNPTVRNQSIQWVPWVTGLPVAEQPVSWLAGQYEINGNVSNYYVYAATWGRGIWKRAAIGSDL